LRTEKVGGYVIGGIGRTGMKIIACSQAGMKQKIDAHTLNGNGIRETSRPLKLNKGTIIQHLKKNYSNGESLSVK